MRWLKRAFAVDPPGPTEPTAEQRPVIEALCREVVRRRLTTPALLALEMSRPLNFLGSQAMHFLGPIIGTLSQSDRHRHLAEFMEHRGSTDYLCRRIEEIEAEATERESAPDKPKSAE